MEALRHFDVTHIDQDCKGETGVHNNELFFNCVFDKLNGLTLSNCDLNKSQFVTQSVRDALDFTLTLNCFSFNNVEFSPLLFDLFMALAYLSKGNDVKREKLIAVVGKDRMEALLRVLGVTE